MSKSAMRIVKRLNLIRVAFVSRLIVITLAMCPILYLLASGSVAPRMSHGDFPAFYTGAAIAWERACAPLYDLRSQGDVQETFFPERVDYFHPFAYPVPLAVVMGPLSLFPPNFAYVIHLSIMFGLLWASVCLLARVREFPLPSRVVMLAYLLLFTPGYVGWVNGQISAYVFFCFTMFVVNALKLSSTEGSEQFRYKEIGLGLAIGGLLLKPQFALIPAAYCMYYRQWRALSVVCGMGIFWYFMGAWSCGFLWPLDWLGFVTHYNAMDQGLNGEHMVSIPGVIAHILNILGMQGSSSLPLYLSIISLIIFVVWMASRYPSGGSSREGLILRIPLIAVLLSPHSLGYDSIAFLFPLLSLRLTSKGVALLVIVQISVMLLEMFKYLLPVNPLALLACVLFVCAPDGRTMGEIRRVSDL